MAIAIKDITKKASLVFERYPVKRGLVFGSVIRGDAHESSDIDILIELDYGSDFSYLDLVRMERELTEALGRSVDLSTMNSLSPYIKETVIKESQSFYER